MRETRAHKGPYHCMRMDSRKCLKVKSPKTKLKFKNVQVHNSDIKNSVTTYHVYIRAYKIFSVSQT